jgi:hypothetical protein
MHAASVTGTAARQMRRTHLRIMSENLERLGVRIKAPALLSLTAPPHQVLEQMVQLHRLLLTLVKRAPSAQREAYELGAENTFYFLREMAISEYGIAFACDFLDRTEGWRRMRRRETYTLKALRGAPLVAEWTWNAMRGWDKTSLRLRSRRIGPMPLADGIRAGGGEHRVAL